MSKQHPEDFLNYLQQAWKRDKIYAKENPESMLDLKALRVLCQDGKYRPLGSTYVPLPKLVYLRSRYMLESEPFPFLRVDPPLKPDGGFGPWRCLRSFSRYHCDLDFFLEMLIRVRRQSQKGSPVQFPRRILELYLRIQAECEDSKDTEGCQKIARYEARSKPAGCRVPIGIAYGRDSRVTNSSSAPGMYSKKSSWSTSTPYGDLPASA